MEVVWSALMSLESARLESACLESARAHSASAALPPPWLVPLDSSSATPVYVQVARGLRERIESGLLPGGTALPAERELAAHLCISRVTVRQALSLLAQQGLLLRRHGSGTFVSGQPTSSHSLGLLSSFSSDVEARGQRPGAQVLSFDLARPTPHETMTLGLSPTENVYRLRRLRTADDEPLAVEESTLPAVLVGTLSETEVTDQSLYRLLERRQLRPERAIRHLRAVSAEPQLAQLLHVRPGSALLATERVSWTSAGRPIEYARAHYRGDRYDFVMELHATGEAREP